MKNSVKSKINMLVLIGSTLLMSNHAISQIVPFDQLIANVVNGGAYNKSIEWNTSMWGAGFGHKIYSDDYNGKTYLKFAARHNSGTWSDMMTLTSQGHVGIGTKSPSVALSVEGYEDQTTLGSNTLSAIRIANTYTPSFGRRSELQFGLVENLNLAVIAAEYTGWGGPSDIAGDLVFGTNPIQSNSVVERMRITNNGNVGIGYNAPEAKLHILDPVALGTGPSSKLRLFSASGNAGSNFVSQSTWLHRSTSGSDWFSTSIHDGLSVDSSFKDPGLNTRTWWERQPYLDIQTWGNAGTTYMSLDQGKLRLGATRPQSQHADAMLSVDGKIVSKSIYVTQQNWADYVFEDNYVLRPLSEVESFINANGHLPNVPSAKQVEIEGISVGEMAKIQQEKIEELTLYIIQLNKKIESLESKLK